jgi:glycosyltransferase involved in cell wall biosynthesis
MTEPTYPRIICLSNVFDQHYHDLRGEKVDRCLTLVKRQGLFQCLTAATGRELVVLSSPPKAAERRKGRWLPPMETEFAGYRQFFCGNWDVPKLRVPLGWFFYARHVLRHVRSGDLVVIDNYEFIYVVAARLLRLFRRVTFMLDYEDGKHLIDRGWCRVLGGLAEWAGRPLIRAATLAHPRLGERLPVAIPTELTPGFMPEKPPGITRTPGSEIRFLYAGALDHPRGVSLIFEALAYLPKGGWRLEIAGDGPMRELVKEAARSPQWRENVTYHGVLSAEANSRLMAQCHVGLNCQRASDPISSVTFPSKVFTYLSAGLLVISSKASAMEQICGNACLYYDEETPQSLAAAMREVIEHFSAVRQNLDRSVICQRYSLEATTVRVKRLLNAVGV